VVVVVVLLVVEVEVESDAVVVGPSWADEPTAKRATTSPVEPATMPIRPNSRTSESGRKSGVMTEPRLPVPSENQAALPQGVTWTVVPIPAQLNTNTASSFFWRTQPPLRNVPS